MTRQRAAHTWAFKPRFRRQAFGWRSQPAIRRIREAVSEIKKVARADLVLAGEGAVLFLERASPALENIDSSSGAIGTAVNHAIEALTPIIAQAPADAATRDEWLERLWDACAQDDIPYLEGIGGHWGELCASPDVASRWADELMPVLRTAWSPDADRRGYFKGTSHCLSALLAAQRHEELLQLLETAPFRWWNDRQYGVSALCAMGRPAEAIRYAEESRGLNDDPRAIGHACEEILLSSGCVDEAYGRYGLLANQVGTNLAWFRAVAKKYPNKRPVDILTDLAKLTPGDEGKWFAAAKDAGLYDEALALARQSPCDPRTLGRAARDFAEKNPAFAVQAGLTSLHWLTRGYGYEITSADVWGAYAETLRAAEGIRAVEDTRERIRQLVVNDSSVGQIVTTVLGRILGLR